MMYRSRTDELLLFFLRADRDGSRPDRVGELSSADWEDLLQASARHCVTPLLYHCLSSSHQDVPIAAEVLRSLRNSYLQSAARNAQLYHELGKVLGRLRQAEIPVIALKGAHLAAVVYGNIALRPMNDVDLLVRTADLERTEETLLGLGYRPAECNRLITKDNCHFVYTLAEKNSIVEVHWGFLPSRSCFTIDMAGVWERTEPVELAGKAAATLCPEDQVLYLCLHASKHLFGSFGLKPLYDISEVIRHYGEKLDWNQIRFRGEQWGIEKCLYAILTLAEELFGIALPAELLPAVQPVDLDERFLVLGREQIFAGGHRTADGLSLSPNLAHLFGSRRGKNKAILFLQRAFPSPEEMSRRYPAAPGSSKFLFYYPAHIRWLLLRYGREVWRLMRRDAAMRLIAKQENEISIHRDWLMSPGRIHEKP